MNYALGGAFPVITHMYPRSLAAVTTTDWPSGGYRRGAGRCLALQGNGIVAPHARIGAVSYSTRSLAFTSAVLCHCMFSGESAPPRFSGTILVNHISRAWAGRQSRCRARMQLSETRGGWRRAVAGVAQHHIVQTRRSNVRRREFLPTLGLSGPMFVAGAHGCAARITSAAQPKMLRLPRCGRTSTSGSNMPLLEQTKKQILLVEDEGLIATDVQRRLERLGYSVPAIAQSGEEALRCARATPFDLVLMDIRIKGEMDGIATAAALKAEFEAPVVYMTAHSDESTLNRAMLTEPIGYLLKPICDDNLRSALQIAIYKSERERKRLEQTQARLTHEVEARQQTLESIIQNAPACIALLSGPDFTFETVNSAYQDLIPDEPMVGRTVAEVWPEAAPLIFPFLNVVRETQTVYHATEVRIPRRSTAGGPVEERYFDFSYVPLPGRSGDVQVLAIAVEVTRHKRAEAALRAANRELATIYGSAPVALLVVDSDLRVRKLNDMAARFAGTPASELVGAGFGGALGCLRALADPQGCGHGPSCAECPMRIAALDSLRNGTRHDDVEAWAPFCIEGRVEQRCLSVSTSFMQPNGQRKVLICIHDMGSSPPGSSRRAGGYSPVLRLTADEMSLPYSPVPKSSPSGTRLYCRGGHFG